VTEYEAIFTINWVPQSNITGLVDIYFDVGAPKNLYVLKNTDFSLQPRLIEIIP